jgi:predicted permease
VLLKPLPYRDASRLVAVSRTFPKWRGQPILGAMWDRVGFAYPVFREWAARQTAFEAVGLWASGSRTLTGVGDAEQLSVVRASASLLHVLDVRPAAGRFFLPGEDGPAGARVAVIAHELAVARFGGPVRAVGATVRLDEVPHEIVGVLPAGFDLGARGRPSPLWIPAGAERSDTSRGRTDYSVVGRLRAGASLARATDEARRLLAESDASDPTQRVGARLAVWQHDVTRSARRPLLLLLGASGLLLALACVNVATLMLGEASGRIGEFATRAALGGPRSRMARQLLAEGATLGALGVALGAGAAAAALRALVALAPADVPRLATARVDLRVLAVSSAAAVLVSLLAGLAPALMLSRASPGTLVQAAGGPRATRRHEQRTLRGLVAAQLALSCLLLVGAGLLGRSLVRLAAVDPGFHADGVLLIRLGATGGRWADADRARSLFRDAAERIATLPGVDRAAVGSAVPFSGGASSGSVEVEGHPAPEGAPAIQARQSYVLPGFSETLGLRLLAGRTIDARDVAGAPGVVVVNETMARRFWPDESALGKRVRFADEWHTVVGVVADVKHASLGDTTRLSIYLSEAQHHTPYLMIVARTRGDAASLAPAVRRAVAALDPGVPVTRVDAMRELVDRSFAPERFRAALSGTFALVAAALAAVGIYGVTARAVARQAREVGIRMALGSTPARVVALFLGRAGSAAGAGVAAGAVAALAASRALGPYLFATDAADPLVYAGSAGVLLAAACAASWLPARRAARADPAAVLRDG